MDDEKRAYLQRFAALTDEEREHWWMMEAKTGLKRVNWRYAEKGAPWAYERGLRLHKVNNSTRCVHDMWGIRSEFAVVCSECCHMRIHDHVTLWVKSGPGRSQPRALVYQPYLDVESARRDAETYADKYLLDVRVGDPADHFYFGRSAVPIVFTHKPERSFDAKAWRESLSSLTPPPSCDTMNL